MNDGVYYADLTQFVGDLARAEGKTTEEVANKVIQSMGAEVANLGRRYAPVDTGALRSSITVTHGELTSSVKATAPYAAYVEFGTWSYNAIAPQSGTYSIRPRKPGGSLAFPGKGGKTVFAREVRHPGIKPQPYLGRAAEEVTTKFTETLGNVAVQLIVKGEKG